MSLNHRQQEDLHSIHARCADIQRYVLTMGVGDRLSADRLREIKWAAEYISDLADKITKRTEAE